MQDPVLFALAVLTLLITPGPTNTLLATAGATGGFRRSAHLLLAELAGYNISIYILGNLFEAQTSGSKIRTVLSVVAGAYLLFTAIRFWRTRLELQRATVSMRHVFVTTLLNPKALVFAFLIVPMHTPNTWLYLASFRNRRCRWLHLDRIRYVGGPGRGQQIPYRRTENGVGRARHLRCHVDRLRARAVVPQALRKTRRRSAATASPV